MPTCLSWLPSPLHYDTYKGNDKAFINAAYEIFCRDFKASRPIFNGKPVIIDTRITYDGKEETFWHMISSKSSTTLERIPDYERLQRLPWARPIIDGIGRRTEILVWTNERYNRAKKRLHIHTPVLLNDTQYPHLLILQEQKNVVAILSAYHIKPNSHQHRKHLSEYNSSI